MREIKFRAWDKDNKEMVYFDFYGIDDGTCFAGERSLQLGDVPVMQFTGLKDKNGKEIYEGDIVKVHLGKLPATVILPAQIIYSSECQFIAQGIGNHGHWTLNSSHIEIIGNIH